MLENSDAIQTVHSKTCPFKQSRISRVRFLGSWIIIIKMPTKSTMFSICITACIGVRNNMSVPTGCWSKKVNGNVTVWLKKGKLHHIGPSQIQYVQYGYVRSREWCWKGELHRVYGPAQIRYWEDGSVWEEGWKQVRKQYYRYFYAP